MESDGTTMGVRLLHVELDGPQVMQRGVDLLERTLIDYALQSTPSRKAAAEYLGISLRALYYKMRRLNIPTRTKVTHV